MSYIGNQPPDIGAYDVESFDGGGTSFTLKRAATVSSVLLFIDGVRQTPTDAYTVSGVTLTTTATTPSGTDNVTVMFMGDVVDIGAPSADTVSTAKIQDDAVTADKLANSINTEIAANTAKVTNATHTGDVTGATALTIATDAVDIAMLSATGTADATTFLRGDNAWAAAGGGKVLQVLTATDSTQRDTTSTSFVTASNTLTVDITPSATTSKVLIMVSTVIGNNTEEAQALSTIFRDSTNLGDATKGMLDTYHYGGTTRQSASLIYLDSPSSTSALTYQLYVRGTGGTTETNYGGGTGSIIVMEIGA